MSYRPNTTERDEYHKQLQRFEKVSCFEELLSPERGYTKMWNWITCKSGLGLKGLEAQLYAFIFNLSLSSDDVHPSYNYLAELFNTTPPTISKALKALCNKNLIAVSGGTFWGIANSYSCKHDTLEKLLVNHAQHTTPAQIPTTKETLEVDEGSNSNHLRNFTPPTKETLVDHLRNFTPPTKETLVDHLRNFSLNNSLNNKSEIRTLDDTVIISSPVQSSHLIDYFAEWYPKISYREGTEELLRLECERYTVTQIAEACHLYLESVKGEPPFLVMDLYNLIASKEYRGFIQDTKNDTEPTITEDEFGDELLF